MCGEGYEKIDVPEKPEVELTLFSLVSSFDSNVKLWSAYLPSQKWVTWAGCVLQVLGCAYKRNVG